MSPIEPNRPPYRERRSLGGNARDADRAVQGRRGARRSPIADVGVETPARNVLITTIRRNCSDCSWERGRLAHEEAMRHQKALCSAGGLLQE